MCFLDVMSDVMSDDCDVKTVMSVNCIFKHLLTSQYNPPNNIQKEIIALSRFVLDDKNNHTDNLYNALSLTPPRLTPRPSLRTPTTLPCCEQ